MSDAGQGPVDLYETEAPNEILDLVSQLEELVATSRRMPIGHKVMVDEAEFLYLVRQMKETVPREIQIAERVILERETIIGEAQEEAQRILSAARQHAEYIVSEQGVLNEARKRAEDLLREVELARRRSLSDIDQYALQHFAQVDDAIQTGLRIIMDAVAASSAEMESARRHIGH